VRIGCLLICFERGAEKAVQRKGVRGLVVLIYVVCCEGLGNREQQLSLQGQELLGKGQTVW